MILSRACTCWLPYRYYYLQDNIRSQRIGQIGFVKCSRRKFAFCVCVLMLVDKEVNVLGFISVEIGDISSVCVLLSVE